MFELSIKPAATMLSLAMGLCLMAGPASANSHLNCDAYAQAAVNQQVKNVQLKCGFTGAAWQTNYNAHKNWCNDPARTINQVSIEDANRKQALQQCGSNKIVFIPLKDCNSYAQNAINQQALNLSLKCGFGGGRWSTNYQAHLNWCQNGGVTLAQVNGEAQARVQQLKGCYLGN